MAQEQETLWMSLQLLRYGVAPGAGEAVNEDTGALVGVGSGAGDAVDEARGALMGVASGAG